ncbi:MAG: Av71 muscle cell intermediate filament [Verrucomicrobia bacterium]|nr:MAG: Av71 muscle cell intermediate filament [Verrucomicrobiota bacterium]
MFRRQRSQRSEVGGQRSEVRGQKSEVRSQRSEVRGQVRSQKEIRSQMSGTRAVSSGHSDL